MRQALRIIWHFMIFIVMFWVFIISVLYGFSLKDAAFDESGTLYFLMNDWLNIPMWIIIILLTLVVLTPFLLYKFLRKNWVKHWKILIPIYNIYVLLWTIGVWKWLFSIILCWIPMYLFFKFTSGIRCDGIAYMPMGYDLRQFVNEFWYMPRYLGYNDCGWYWNFMLDIFLFVASLYVIFFVMFLFYRLLKYYHNQNKKNN